MRQNTWSRKKTRGVRKEGAEPDVIEKVAPEPASDPLPNLMKAFAKRTQAPGCPARTRVLSPGLKKLDAELDDLFP